MSKKLADALGSDTPEVVKCRHKELKETTGDSDIDWDRALEEYRQEANSPHQHADAGFEIR